MHFLPGNFTDWDSEGVNNRTDKPMHANEKRLPLKKGVGKKKKKRKEKKKKKRILTQNVISTSGITGNVEDVRVIGRDDYQSILPCHLLASGHSGVKSYSFLQSPFGEVVMVTMVNASS